MITIRRRFIRRIGTLCAVGLLLLPLLFSAHRHGASQTSTSDACALCVVTHFSPTTTAPPLPQLAPLITAAARALIERVPLVNRSQPRPGGRAPPEVPPSRTV